MLKFSEFGKNEWAAEQQNGIISLAWPFHCRPSKFPYTSLWAENIFWSTSSFIFIFWSMFVFNRTNSKIVVDKNLFLESLFRFANKHTSQLNWWIILPFFFCFFHRSVCSERITLFAYPHTPLNCLNRAILFVFWRLNVTTRFSCFIFSFHALLILLTEPAFISTENRNDKNKNDKKVPNFCNLIIYMYIYLMIFVCVCARDTTKKNERKRESLLCFWKLDSYNT